MLKCVAIIDTVNFGKKKQGNKKPIDYYNTCITLHTFTQYIYVANFERMISKFL